MVKPFDLFLRLCRLAVRKGCAFPGPTLFESCEATPRKPRGVASDEFGRRPESRRLSAQRGGKAATPGFSIVMTWYMAAALLALAPAASAQESAVSPSASPAVSPEQTLRAPFVATEYRAKPVKPLPPPARVGVDVGEQKPLTLREAITMALTNNKDIEVARDTVAIAEADLLSMRGVYDPRLSAQAYFERIISPATSFLSGAAKVETSDLTATSRLEGLAPKFGGSYRVDFASIRQTSNSQFSVLNPQYPTALTFNFTQPLMRGLRFDLPRRQIEVAKKNLTLTDAQFRQRAVEVITSVQRSYWDLVFTLRNLQIQRDAVRDARVQLEHNRRLVSEGVLAPIDIVAVETQVANFEQAEFTALDDVTRAENNLKNLIVENQQSPLWNLSIIPTDNVDLTPPQIPLPEAMKAAVANRQELKVSDLAREINQLDQKLYREQTKPQVDLVGSYGMVGNAGTLTSSTNPFTATSDLLRARVNQLSVLAGLPPLPAPPATTIPPDLLGGYSQSLSNLGSNQFNNFRAGVSLSLPLRNRTAEGQLGHALAEGKRIATQREQLEQLIQVEVRNALQSLTTAEGRLRSAAVARDNAQRQYQSEKRKLDVGQSTVFLVLERQTALANARNNELRAQTDLNKAIAEIQRATGNSLTANNVSVTVR